MDNDFLNIMKLLRDGGIPHDGQLAIITALLIADRAIDDAVADNEDPGWPKALYGTVACAEIKRLAEQI